MIQNLREIKKRLEKLRQEINRYRHAYHVLDKTFVSESVLDSLKKELFDLEQQFPDLITPDSPTQRVAGKPLPYFEKVRHEKPMISLNDAFSEEDVQSWIKRLENYLGKELGPEPAEGFYCEYKIDGLSIELVYENGVFVQGSTRGDGITGEDITQNLKTVEAIPLKLQVSGVKYQVPKKLIVRGEVFLTKKEFERINKELEKEDEKTFANPRNLAAGTVRQLDPEITAHRKLDSFEYAIVSDVGQKKHEDEHKLLESWGFKTNPHNKKVSSIEGIFEFQKSVGKEREKIPYEIDGVVIIVNDNKTFETAGVIGKAPRGAIAYKFSPKEATTIVEDIQAQVGRTGAITPVAVLKPVQVGGITITHATLHNYDEVERLGIKIGDTVIITRAGDVIPQVSKVLTEMRTGKGKAVHPPKVCPVDGSTTIKEGAILRCSNKNCGARQRESLYHFVAAFNIDGMGPKIVDRFLDEGLIGDAADIFTVQKGDIEALERFGEKSAENLVVEISQRKSIALDRFIYSLGILHVGEETARLIAQRFISSSKVKSQKSKVLELLDYLSSLSVEELQEIPDIGPAVAKSIHEFFRDKRHLELIKKFDKVGVQLEIGELKVKSSKLKDLTFVLTGTMESMSRDEAKQKIRQLGGDISESVSKKTSYVVAGSEVGSKLDKAQKLGVKVLDEKEFLKIIS